VSKPLPWVKFEKLENNAGRFVAEPLERGMGTTLGNALRRVLLSSLPGYAVTAMRIEGIQHEFSTIPGVMEDVLDVIANLKKIVFASQDDVASELSLTLKKGMLKAGDIKLPTGVAILNPELHIIEVTEDTKLTLIMRLQKGLGYSPSEAHVTPDQPIDTINLDASFSPILRVNHQVESIRVGKELDFDSLHLDVWTDGSISSESAVQWAADILIDRFALFRTLNEKPASANETSLTADENVKGEKNKEAVLSLTIDDLELSARSSNCLKRAGIETVMELVDKDIADLIQIKNFGKKSADEINAKLSQYGLALKGTEVL